MSMVIGHHAQRKVALTGDTKSWNVFGWPGVILLRFGLPSVDLPARDWSLQIGKQLIHFIDDAVA